MCRRLDRTLAPFYRVQIVRLQGGTLAIDIGGTGLKAAVLDPDGKPVNERVRMDTPRPAEPSAILVALGALKKVGKRQWNKRVKKMIEQLDSIFNYRMLYLGGGNAKKIELELPADVRVVDNVAGILGGIRLWR